MKLHREVYDLAVTPGAELRKEARVQLDAVESQRREASQTLKNLTAAAGESWREIKQSADAI